MCTRKMHLHRCITDTARLHRVFTRVAIYGGGWAELSPIRFLDDQLTTVTYTDLYASSQQRVATHDKGKWGKQYVPT